MTCRQGNEFYSLVIPESWVGRPFIDLFVEMKKEKNVTLIAVESQSGKMETNPDDYRFEANDKVIYLAEKEMKF
ncbi:MAG: hypothetical protein MPJ24_09685 [Pirellulaceae bacterium]|nr:hypothetical protein [Pirellulaceae bacterium]